MALMNHLLCVHVCVCVCWRCLLLAAAAVALFILLHLVSENLCEGEWKSFNTKDHHQPRCVCVCVCVCVGNNQQLTSHTHENNNHPLIHHLVKCCFISNRKEERKKLRA